MYILILTLQRSLKILGSTCIQTPSFKNSKLNAYIFNKNLKYNIVESVGYGFIK